MYGGPGSDEVGCAAKCRLCSFNPAKAKKSAEEHGVDNSQDSEGKLGTLDLVAGHDVKRLQHVVAVRQVGG